MNATTTTTPPLYNRIDRFDDETDTSSVSGYDSEWTQISGTEDDGEASPMTADGGDRALSRETTDENIDGEVWEGFVDEASLSANASEDEMLHDALATLSDVERHEAEAQFDDAIAAAHDQRVNDALNCSVIGTLRATRTRSMPSSLQNSFMDPQTKLRLSFPDPLIRSVEGMVSPFDNVDSSELDSTVIKTEPEEGDISFSRDSSNFTDVGCSSTPNVSKSFDEDSIHSSIPPSGVRPHLALVFYGSASAPKWQIGEKLVRLATGRSQFQRIGAHGNTRLYQFDDDVAAAHSLPLIIQLVDRTSVKDSVRGYSLINTLIAHLCLGTFGRL